VVVNTKVLGEVEVTSIDTQK
jgi:hypothetical protein